MRWLVDLFVQVRASSLGQDAVIEIMIALLGIMIAVLTLVIGVAAFLGYRSLKDEVVQAAFQRAEEIATKVARESTETALAEGRLQEQASSIVEAVQPSETKEVAAQSPKHPTQMLGDADLKKGKGDSNDRSRKS